MILSAKNVDTSFLYSVPLVKKTSNFVQHVGVAILPNALQLSILVEVRVAVEVLVMFHRALAEGHKRESVVLIKFRNEIG